MLQFDHEALSALGLTPAIAGRATVLETSVAAAGETLRLTRIIEVHRESVVVHDGRDACVARVLPRAARMLQDEATALAVGDWVEVTVDRFGDAWVSQRVPPVSHIARRDADGSSHPIVSNVDLALLVMGLDDDFNPRRLERFLALVHDEAIVKVVVLTKADVLPDHVVDERVALLRARIPSHLPLLALNALDPEAAGILAGYLMPGSTLVMLGSSGAGKSSLTNTLMGAAIQDTGPVRVHDSRGKHTTTSRSLHRLPGGACVIDTPGLRTLRPDADVAALADGFPDVEALAAGCRFRDCRHGDEPGCAVRAGVDPDRLRNYHKLLRELARDSMSALERQKLVQLWKMRGRAAKARMKQKRGEDAF